MSDNTGANEQWTQETEKSVSLITQLNQNLENLARILSSESVDGPENPTLSVPKAEQEPEPKIEPEKSSQKQPGILDFIAQIFK